MEESRTNVASLWAALTAALTAFLALVVAHDVDHVVNEQRLGDLSASFWVVLPFQYAALVAVVLLSWRRSPLAPTLAVAVAGIALLAFAGAHLAPFGPLPYADGDPLPISWALVYVPMAVAVVVLVLGLRLRSAIGEPRRPATG